LAPASLRGPGLRGDLDAPGLRGRPRRLGGRAGMTRLRTGAAARFIGVSDDTVRRWVSGGRLTQHNDSSNRAVVEGRELAALAQSSAGSLPDASGVLSSARTRFAGLLPDVVVDGVIAPARM